MKNTMQRYGLWAFFARLGAWFVGKSGFFLIYINNHVAFYRIFVLQKEKKDEDGDRHMGQMVGRRGAFRALPRLWRAFPFRF